MQAAVPELCAAFTSPGTPCPALQAKANKSHTTGWRWGRFKEMFGFLLLKQGQKFPDQHSPTAAGASPVRYRIPLCSGETEARGDTLPLRAGV